MATFGVWKEPDKATLDAIRDKRAGMLEWAARLFGEHGYAALDVQMVADAVGIGKATLYRQFESKEGLFLAALDREMELLTRRMQEDAESVAIPFDALCEGVRSYFRFFTERPWVAELLLIERSQFRKSSKSTFDAYGDLVRPYWIARGQELVDAGEMTISAEDAFELLSDALYGALFTHSLSTESSRFIDRGERIIRATLCCWVDRGREPSGSQGIAVSEVRPSFP